MSFLPLIVIMLLMYMFLIRPQQKARKEQIVLLNSLVAGDEVELDSGIYGTISEVVEGKQPYVWLNVFGNKEENIVELKVARQHIKRKIPTDIEDTSNSDDAPNPFDD